MPHLPGVLAHMTEALEGETTARNRGFTLKARETRGLSAGKCMTMVQALLQHQPLNRSIHERRDSNS